MSDDESRSSGFSEENEEDDEETMAEEELLDDAENGDELRMLNEENEMSVEELRRLYYGAAAAEEAQPGPSSSSADQPSSSKALDSSKSSSSNIGYFGDVSLNDEEEDEDYVPLSSDYWKKEIRVGDDYQVQLPLPEVKEVKPEEYKSPVESKALWIPMEMRAEDIQTFLKEVRSNLHNIEGSKLSPASARRPICEGVADDEDALYALYKANYDVKAVLDNLPFERANGPKIRGPERWKKMSSEEVEEFEKAFREIGKDFFKIHQERLPARTVGELIQFYYSWKKTERYDMFMAANRVLGLADGLDKSVDPMEVIAEHAMNSSNGSSINIPVREPAPQKTWLSVQPEHSHHPEKADKS